MWICSKCLTTVESTFDVCWSCGTSDEGDEDPSFATADEVDPATMEPPVVAARPEPPAQDGADAPPTLVECYRPRDGLEAQFLVDHLAEYGIWAVATGTAMGNTEYVLPLFAPRIEVRSCDFARARSLVQEFERRRKARRNPLDDLF